jgi:hypothetical protein
MERKRKNIPAGVRWQVFSRDGFRCIYCGATKETATLVIDHGDPFSRGGGDDIDNYVTACRQCNAGKAAKQAIPKAAWEDDSREAAFVRSGERHKSQLLADWHEAFSCAWLSVAAGGSHVVRCITGFGDDHENPCSSEIDVDFVLRDHVDGCGQLWESLNAVILPLKDDGEYSSQEQSRVRDAAILGYCHPTMIILGSPWNFYGAVVDDRYKGCPAGWAIDDYLMCSERVWAGGWYPDECWDYADIRSEFGLTPRKIGYRATNRSLGKESANGL